MATSSIGKTAGLNGNPPNGKIVTATTTISSISSLLGSWQICHALCLAIISALAIIGITLNTLPLLFLTGLAVPLWITAVTLLFVSVLLYAQKKCVPAKILLFNGGIIVAGVPFDAVQEYVLLFWIIGGTIVVIGMSLWIHEKYTKKEKECARKNDSKNTIKKGGTFNEK